MKSFFNAPSQHCLQDFDFCIRILYFFLFVFYIFSGFDACAAANDDPIGTQLCKILTTLEGTTAKVIGAVALSAMGISFFMGKVNWGVMITTSTGVIIIFGAAKIVGFLSGSESAGCEQ